MEHEYFDLLDFIMAYEGDEEMDNEVMIEGFQHLINTGEVWTLQGHYGRRAAALIASGHCTDPQVRRQA
jgi:hypothetical protein